MITSRGRAIAHAHPGGSPALSALIAFDSYWLLPISTTRQRSMPVSQFSRPSLPRFRYSDLGMLNRRGCAVAHAHPIAAPACSAQVAGVAHSVMLTQSGRSRGLPFLAPRASAYPPRWPNTPIQPTPLAASEIGAILRAKFCYNDIAIYRAARLMGNSLGGSHHCLCHVQCPHIRAKQ